MHNPFWAVDNFPALMNTLGHVLGPTGQFILGVFLIVAFFVGVCEEEDEETQARKRREADRRGE